MASTERSTAERSWHASYPAPKAIVPAVTRETVLSWMREGKLPGKDFVLVDVRRTDYEGGTIHGSINLPAQSLYPTIPSLYTLCSAAGVKNVIWFCSSSKGRGTRTAGWFADHIKEQGDTAMVSSILEGGVKGWATSGGEYVKLIDEYDASVWMAS